MQTRYKSVTNSKQEEGEKKEGTNGHVAVAVKRHLILIYPLISYRRVSEIPGEQRVGLGGAVDAEPRLRRRDRPHRLLAEAEVDRRAGQAARHPRDQR